MRDALIVALDVENVEAARALVEKLGDSVHLSAIVLAVPPSLAGSISLML